MPRDVKGKPVEGYKISPELKSILREYQKVKRIEGMLKYETAVQAGKFQDLREMWGSLQARSQELLDAMPENATRDLEGMDFPQRPQMSREEMQLRY